MTTTTRARRGRGEGGISQRDDGLWVATLSLGIGPDGKRRKRVCYGRTKAEAAAKLRALQGRADVGALPDKASLTVAGWLVHWLAVIAPTVEPGTLQPYRRHVDRFIVPRLGRVKLASLRRSEVQAFYAGLLADGVSPAMARKIGTTLTAALNAAVDAGELNASPASRVKKPRGEKPAIEVLAPDEAAKLAAACDGHRLGALFLLMLDGGLGPGEAFALTWGDVDTIARTVRVVKSLEEINGRHRVKAPKTKQRNRTVDVSEKTAAALARHREAMRSEGRSVDLDSLVFVAPRFGGFLRQSNVHRNDWKPLLKASGLPDVSLYALRHTAATLLLLANVNPKVVSERLGHSSIKLTLDTYQHVLPTMQKAAAEAMGRFLDPSSAPEPPIRQAGRRERLRLSTVSTQSRRLVRT